MSLDPQVSNPNLADSDMSAGDIHARYRLGRKNFYLDVDVKLPGQGVTAVMGASGSGKTSLLRCIAGLEKPADGFLRVGSETWESNDIYLPTYKRPVGVVFQDASLFPHLSAKANLYYAIKRSAQNTPGLFEHVSHMMGIENVLDQLPQQLSGGERQRVAIARALLIQPKLMLMDEPLASLDAQRKQEILPYLEKLHEDFSTPVIYVSHAMEEVARLADHVLVMKRGEIAAEGDVRSVFGRLDFPSRADSEADVVLEGLIADKDQRWGLARVDVAGVDFWVADTGRKTGDSVRIRVQARDISLALDTNTQQSILNRLPAQVTAIKESEGAAALVQLKVGNSYLLARVTRKSLHDLKVTVGMELCAQIKSVAIIR